MKCFTRFTCGVEIMRKVLRITTIISYQLKLIKMRAELANRNPCAVPFLHHAAFNLWWYYLTLLS